MWSKQAICIALLASMGTSLLFQKQVYATEDVLVAECKIKRLEANLKKIGLVSSNLKNISYEDECNSKEFCFKAELTYPAVIADFSVPKNSEIRYCEIRGLEAIFTKDLSSVKRKDLTCGGGVTFENGKVCSCQTMEKYQVDFQKDGKKYSTTLPARTGLTFKEGKLAYFNSPEKIDLSNLTVKKDQLYWIGRGDIVEVDRDAKRIECLKPREPEDEDFQLIHKNYGISKSNLEDVRYSDKCDGDTPTNEPERAVRAIAAEDFTTKNLSLVKGTYLSFCNGVLRSISSARGNRIKVWGQSCGTYVSADNHPESFEKVTYSCGQSQPVKMGGVTLPPSVSINFDKKGVRCFSLMEGAPEEKFLGVELKEYNIYSIKNGKVANGCIR